MTEPRSEDGTLGVVPDEVGHAVVEVVDDVHLGGRRQEMEHQADHHDSDQPRFGLSNRNPVDDGSADDEQHHCNNDDRNRAGGHGCKCRWRLGPRCFRKLARRGGLQLGRRLRVGQPVGLADVARREPHSSERDTEHRCPHTTEDLAGALRLIDGGRSTCRNDDHHVHSTGERLAVADGEEGWDLDDDDVGQLTREQ